MSSYSVPAAMVVEDVFSVTGRGVIVTGYPHEDVRIEGRVGIFRDGQLVATATVNGPEMIRRTCSVPPGTPQPTGFLLCKLTADNILRGDELRLLPAEEGR